VTSNYRYCGSVTDILEITRADASMLVRPGVDCLCEEVKRKVMKRVVEWRDCGIGSFGQSIYQSKIGYCRPVCIWKTHRTKPFLRRNFPIYVRYDGTPDPLKGVLRTARLSIHEACLALSNRSQQNRLQLNRGTSKYMTPSQFLLVSFEGCVEIIFSTW